MLLSLKKKINLKGMSVVRFYLENTQVLMMFKHILLRVQDDILTEFHGHFPFLFSNVVFVLPEHDHLSNL